MASLVSLASLSVTTSEWHEDISILHTCLTDRLCRIGAQTSALMDDRNTFTTFDFTNMSLNIPEGEMTEEMFNRICRTF